MSAPTTRTEAFPCDVFLSHSAKDKEVVRASSLSATNGERMWCRNGHFAVGLKEAGLRLWFDEWELPVAASRQSAAFSAGRPAAGRRKWRRSAERPLHGEDRGRAGAFPTRTSAFTLHPSHDAPSKASLTQFL